MADPIAQPDIEQIIEQALIRSVFQPIVDTRRGVIEGYEALSRGPAGTELESPVKLFARAEELGLFRELENLCQRLSLQRFFSANKRDALFINRSTLSLENLHSDRDYTTDIIRELKISPSRVVIELSESHVASDLETLNKTLVHYRSLGMKTAIDDLGTGYSGLQLWSQIVPDYVKLDRHFVKDIHMDPVKREFTQSVAQLADSLGSKLIAEGVETADEYEQLRQFRIAICQGFLFARPDENPNADFDHTLCRPEHHYRRKINYRSCARRLKIQVPPLPTDARLEEATRRFDSNPDISCLPVCEGSEVVGLLHRHQLITLARQFSDNCPEWRQSVRTVMDEKFVQVDESASLEEISRLLTAHDPDSSHHYVVMNNDCYSGIGSANDLLREMTRIKIRNARYANPLTGLLGDVPLQEYIRQARRAKQKVSLAYLDINSFKPFNDAYGFHRGDEVIQLLANLLQRHLDEETSFIGHLGGDDFMVVSEDPALAARLRMVQHEFAQQCRLLYSKEDLKRGGVRGVDRHGFTRDFDLLSVAIGVIPANELETIPSAQLDNYITLTKHESKTRQTGVFMLDKNALPAVQFFQMPGQG